MHGMLNKPIEEVSPALGVYFSFARYVIFNPAVTSLVRKSRYFIRLAIERSNVDDRVYVFHALKNV